MTATEIAAAIRSGEVSALEVLDDHLRRIEARNPELNAIVVEDFERARAAAASPRPGALSGVPFTVKEAIDTAGLPACEASRLRPVVTPATDAPAVARLRAAGAIPIILLLVAGGAMIAYGMAVPGVALLVVAGIAFLMHMAVGAALHTIFLAALYQYAAQDRVPEGFDRNVMASAFGRS